MTAVSGIVATVGQVASITAKQQIMLNQQYVTLHFHTEPVNGQGLVEVVANSLGHLNVYNHLHVNDMQEGDSITVGQLREDMDDDSLLAGYPDDLPIIWFAFPSSLGLHCAMAKLADIIAYSAAQCDETTHYRTEG